MPLTIDLAGMTIGIDASDTARSALTYCKSYFHRFTIPAGDPDASVTLIRSPLSGPQVPEAPLIQEQRLSTEQLGRRVGPGQSFSDGAICAGCRDGCLVYHPDTRSGRLFLDDRSDSPFAPLYRLLWIFFAQALGDLGGVFVHAAAVADGDGRSYLFLGDSGAGKTTLATHAQSGSVLADDGPIVTSSIAHGAGTGLEAFTSPYHQSPATLLHGIRPDAGKTSVRGLYFLDRHGFRGNRQVPAAAAVPLILQRFIHFWGYLTPAARLAAFDLFICACHSIQTYYLTVPKGMDALKWLHSRGLVGGSHD